MLESNTHLFNWLRISGLRVGQVVDGDGEEDVEQDVVAADEQDDEVDAHDLAPTLILKGVREVQTFWGPALCGTMPGYRKVPSSSSPKLTKCKKIDRGRGLRKVRLHQNVLW